MPNSISGGWPKLVVTYNIPEEAPEIEIEEPNYQPADSDSSSEEEEEPQLSEKEKER